MPATNRTRDEQRLVTINCGKVKTFVVIEDRSTHEAWRFLKQEHGILKKHDLPPDLRECSSFTDGYRSAGRVDVIAGGVAGSLEQDLASDVRRTPPRPDRREPHTATP
jgi:hypothetical protein